MITLIAAVALNGVIGMGNTIPWHLPDDFRHFKETTEDHVVIMGGRTWDSLPARFRPLPNRINVVVTSRPLDGCIRATTPLEAIRMAQEITPEREIFVIGGASIYQQLMPLSDRLLISRVKLEVTGDTFFPRITDDWNVVSEREHDGFVIMDYRLKA